MKTFIAVAALMLTVTSAHAQANSGTTGEIGRYIGAEKASALSDAQIAQALRVLNSGDSRSDKRKSLRSIAK